ncbi:hypothetical protein BJ912DRAFT_824107, partial [Pholiota molesta]
MPPRTVSQDLKDRIPVLYYEQDLTVKEICAILGVRKSLVYKTLSYTLIYGVPYNPHTRSRGRHRVLLRNDIKFIQALIERRHCIYLDEIQEELDNHRGISVSIPTLVRTLRRLNYSHKCVSARALERNDIRRAAFMNTIAEEVPQPDMLMFVDEAARNRKTSGRSRGWALVGKRCIQKR